jgi:condensin complex subunit 1
LERNKTTSKVCGSNDGNGEGDGDGEGKDSEEAQITGGGATDEDLEHDMILRICDEELGGSGLLGSFLPLVVSIVTKPSTYPSSQVQTSASLTLAKYMLLSPKICDKYLRLLFTLLETSDVPAIRANTIIALGDLAVRYPNIVEPWTPHLYSRLRDPVYNVRLNTIIVLSRLILYDMIKVKGQISELALCLEDTEQQISDRAKSFFSEFSRKTNALYNVLPDIISNLIDPDSSNISSDAFRNIMK